jgi:hypothetical protein
MTNIRQIYQKKQAENLLEARVTLLQKGIYPFNAFLKEHSQTIETAEQIEKLEEAVSVYKDKLPTLYMLVTTNTETLMESKIDTDAIQYAMINYAFISESIGGCVGEAVKLLKTKHPETVSLKSIYGKDASQLFEFCIKRSETHKLMEGNTQTVIALLAKELSSLPINQLSTLCENIPTIKLYVSSKVHTELAKIIAG